jgi:hypothetical protein
MCPTRSRTAWLRNLPASPTSATGTAWGAHALARDAAGGVGSVEEGPGNYIMMRWLREDLRLARALLPNWPPDRWISIAALCIAALSFLVAYDTSREDRAHKRLSVQPRAAITFLYNDTGAGWILGNPGPGPAVVRSFGVSVDGVPQRNWEAVIRLIGLTGRVSFGTLLPGLMIPQGGSGGGVLFWVTPGPDKDLLMKNVERVEIELCYCSLYNECWLASTHASGLLGKPCSEGKINSRFLFIERSPAASGATQ